MKKLNMVSLAEEAGRGAGCAGRRGFVREARRRVRRRARCTRAANPAFYQALALRRAAAE
ncbi:hypothetical protein [Burkholderia pseudomallei]|uniref:hypothetical protein n=1 Tax=Burkholderia pseudomallei TaxID=28450 RepID=UPI0010161F11|nr:hypothetical protein [Burkholderia pseudomallei]